MNACRWPFGQFLLVTFAILPAASAPLEQCLAPGSTSSSQFVDFDLPNEYCLRDVVANQAYEFKVSYPQATPTIFALTLVARDPIRSKPPGRSLLELDESKLDMEKLEFRTNQEGLIEYWTLPHPLPVDKVYLKVEARERGHAVGLDGPRRGSWYDLRFDPVYFGVPRHAFTLFYLVPMGAMLTAALVYWLLHAKRSPFAALKRELDGIDDIAVDADGHGTGMPVPVNRSPPSTASVDKQMAAAFESPSKTQHRGRKQR